MQQSQLKKVAEDDDDRPPTLPRSRPKHTIYTETKSVNYQMMKEKHRLRKMIQNIKVKRHSIVRKLGPVTTPQSSES